jgi:ribosome biogenesis protein Nip4
MEGTMGPSRTELMQFKVTSYEKKVIEDFVRKRGDTVSEYVRSAVIMDMVLEGEVKAMKIVVDTIGRKAVLLLNKRAKRLEKLGAEATDSQ